MTDAIKERWRQKAENNKKFDDGKYIELKMPPMKFHTHPEILDLAHMVMKMTGHIPPKHEVVAMDVEYVNDLFNYDQGVRFFEDKPKRQAAGMV